ncbi:hypothetical protein D3C83_327790 [compost metagenome]
MTHTDPDTFAVQLRNRTEGELNRLLVEAGVGVSHLLREQPSLEALFFDVPRDAPRGAELAA